MINLRARLMLFISIFLLFALAAAAPLSTAAQGTPSPTKSPDCKPADVLKKAAALSSTGDDQKDLAALLKLAADISAQNVACNGLTFKGNIIVKAIGPIEIPPGLYKVTATTRGYLILKIRLVDPDCADRDGFSIVNVGAGEATTGAEEIVRFMGCKMFLQPSNVDAPWTVTLELLK